MTASPSSHRASGLFPSRVDLQRIWDESLIGKTGTDIGRSRLRLLLVANTVFAIWLFEVIVAHGLYFDRIADSRATTVVGIVALAITADAFLIFYPVRALPESSSGFYKYSRRIGYLLLGLGSALVLYLVPSGRLDYENVIRSADGIGVLAIWGPLLVAGVMVLLYSMPHIRLWDTVLIAGVTVLSLLPGGRTVPTVIVLMFALNLLVYRRKLPKISGKAVASLAVLAIAGAWGLGLVSATRSSGLDTDVWSEQNLAKHGYTSFVPGGAILLANVGVIGEAALVARTTVPEELAFDSPLLAATDLLSFIPGQNHTVDAFSIETYRAFGEPVGTSRPGGLHTSLYYMGGNLAIVGLGALYFWFITHGFEKARARRPLHYASSLLFLSTFVLGAYGVGLPTGMLFLSFVIFGLAVLFAFSLDYYKKKGTA